jgi:hypothetical protein
MDHAITGTPTETVIYGALELSKNSWLLALQLPGRAQPSLYPIGGGDTEGLMAKLMAALAIPSFFEIKESGGA